MVLRKLRNHKEDHLALRRRLLGRSLSPRVLAAFLSQQIRRSLGDADVEQLAKGVDSLSEAEASTALSRELLALQSHRGGEIRRTEASSGRSPVTQSVDPRNWRWQAVISCRWKVGDEHVKTPEVRGTMLAYLWRCRARRNIGSRFVHLVDSMVTLCSLAKGRSSAGAMRFVVKRTNALMLAGFLVPTLAHARSHLNPADKPSRAAAITRIGVRRRPLISKGRRGARTEASSLRGGDRGHPG